MSRYASLFDRLRREREGAIVPFVVLGDPTPALSLRIVDALVEGGADCVELGIPFSDPIADGPTIQAATVRALEAGVTPQICWDLLAQVRAARPQLPIGLLVYGNLVVNEGADRFYARAAEAGIDSVLVADVPSSEARPFVDAAHAAGVDPVLIAPPNADDARLQQIAQLSRGYTYVVTRAGVTGAENEAALSHRAMLLRLREFGAPPCLVGFGISRPEHVRAALDMGAAGAISGSAVVSRIANGLKDERALLEELARYVGELKGAANVTTDDRR